MRSICQNWEYVDPYEEEGPISNTPPPACDLTKDHEICIPPAWGEEIPGAIVRSRCLLCHQEDRHHAVRCFQCQNAPGCCSCIWGCMRSQYNWGCPLCRAGDPCGEDPLGADQRRIVPIRRRELMVYRRGRGGRRRGRGRRGVVGGTLLCGIGRGAGRGQPQEEEEDPLRATDRPQRGRRGERRGGGGRRRGRGTTIEEDKEKN